jgi:hypothetical protein
MTIPKITQKHWDKAYAEHRAKEPAFVFIDICNKAIEIAIAEQQESEYITAEQARELGAGNAEWFCFGVWNVCDGSEGYVDKFSDDEKCLYRAIKQAQPEPRQDMETCLANEAALAWEKLYPKEPVDPHADNFAEESHPAYRAMYAKQVAEGTTGFYLWEYKAETDTDLPDDWTQELPEFYSTLQYRCTDISCYVSKDGEPAIRMLSTEAQELQRKLGDTVEWNLFGTTLQWEGVVFTFDAERTYTYRTKATIKLDGRMVTPEQAAAEWEAKKETHDVWFTVSHGAWVPCSNTQFRGNGEYELRPKALKQPTWTGSREDVIALLKEVGVL